jgi:outer membrane protein assembly factor BamA
MEYECKSQPFVNFIDKVLKQLLKLQAILYGFFIFITIPSLSQTILLCDISLDTINSGQVEGIKGLTVPNVIQSSAIAGIMDNFYAKGFLEAGYEIQSSDSICHIKISPGVEYKWVNLSKGNLPDNIQNQVNYKSGLFDDRVFNFQSVVDFYRKIISWSENNGYPFASIGLKRIKIENHGIEASLEYQSGPSIDFDTLWIAGTNKIKKNFLASYLHILGGHPYEKSKVEEIPELIKSLPGFSLTGNPEEYFMDGKCELKLNIIEKNANGFDGYLGILPNESSPGKILLTGQLDLRLNNLFKSGKSISLNWQRPNLQTQELIIDYIHLCLLNSPVNGYFQFNIYKQDTTFLNTSFNAGLTARKSGLGLFGFDFGFFSSRVIKNDLAHAADQNKFADFNTAYYGINHSYSKINDHEFPLSGWETNIYFKIGIKNILFIPGSDSGSYSAPDKNQLQYKTYASITKYTRLSNLSTIIIRMSGGMINDNQMFYNDLYRLGGLASIRGFNEKYFYSSKYLYGNAEFRVRMEEKSYLIVFSDVGLLYNDLESKNKTNFPIGFGGGFSLGTSIGNLAILYAIGKDNMHPLSFQYSKIHIGYISRF